MTKHLMNIHTGSVDTEENWKSEVTQVEEFESLEEVIKDSYGNWMSVKDQT